MVRDTETPAAVLLDDVAVRVGGRTLWSGAGLRCDPGTFMAVLGPNGAGKTTLLRVLLGLVAPLRGTVSVLGRRPHRGNARIGYVSQRRVLDPEVPVRGRDLVALGLDGGRWGVRPPRRRRRMDDEVERVLEQVGASHIADRGIGRLSGGEQQRLFLAQALVGRPQLLLLDEPLASLDVRNQAEMARLVAGVAHRQGVTTIMVTHDVNPLMGLVDSVAYLARGRMTCGPVGEVISAPVLSAVYDAPIEVLRDARGRVFVVGLEEEVAHPHGV